MRSTIKNTLFAVAVAITFFASSSHAGITLTIAGFTPATSSAGASKPAKSKSSDAKREKGKKMAGSKAGAVTKSKNGSPAGSQNATLNVVSSSFQAGSGGSSGRASGAGGAEAYVITRNMDSQSSAIANAAQTSQVYSSAVIANSSGGTITLSNVYLSSYSTSMSGSSSVETFKVHFQSQAVN